MTLALTLSATSLTYCTDTETMTDSADYPFVLQMPLEVPTAHRSAHAGE